MVRVLMLLCVIVISMYTTEQAHFLQENFITKINEQVTTWKVRHKLFIFSSRKITLNYIYYTKKN